MASETVNDRNWPIWLLFHGPLYYGAENLMYETLGVSLEWRHAVIRQMRPALSRGRFRH